MLDMLKVFLKILCLKNGNRRHIRKDTYVIENWCDIFFIKLKDESDMIYFLKQMKNLAEKKDALSKFHSKLHFGVFHFNKIYNFIDKINIFLFLNFKEDWTIY